MAPLSEMGRQALTYAEKGRLVLPLHSPDRTGCSCRTPGCEHPAKHPRNMRGKDGATRDVDQVTDWWRMWPQANVGVRPAIGEFVIDVDPRNGGDTQLAAMQQRYGPLPETLTAATGGGGLHLWLMCPPEMPLRGKLAPGIDIKNNTGYVVVPPSSHHTGNLYSWVNRAPVAPAPDYLLGLVEKQGVLVATGDPGEATPAMLAGWMRFLEAAVEGERNARLFWVCSRVHEHGADPAPFVDVAVRLGLTRDFAEKTAESAATPRPRIKKNPHATFDQLAGSFGSAR